MGAGHVGTFGSRRTNSVAQGGMTAMSDCQRLSIQDVDPDAYQPMFAMEEYINSGSLGEPLLSLVTMRASQINGCTWCLDMQAQEARTAGLDQCRLDVLACWRDAPELYSEQQRAAIALTEQVTLIGQGGVSDEVWAGAEAAFTDRELVQLLLAIAAINVWNRLAIVTCQDLPGQPR